MTAKEHLKKHAPEEHQECAGKGCKGHKKQAHCACEEKCDCEQAADVIEKLQEEAAHWKDVAARMQAEMENVRKRTQIDAQNARKYANGGFAKDLLPVADYLAKALQSVQTHGGEEKSDFLKNFVAGIELTQKQLESALSANGVEKIKSLGEVFDPHMHEVVSQVADPSKPAGTIIDVLQEGYIIGGDRILREALVVVTG